MSPVTENDVFSLPTPVSSKNDRSSEHFRPLQVSWMEIDLPEEPTDPLGFSYERMKAGEADVEAGRTRPFVELMNALRSRLHRNSG